MELVLISFFILGGLTTMERHKLDTDKVHVL